jgi:2-methylcitrate dehydratase
MDPRIRDQLPKVVVVADAEIEKVFPKLQRVAVTIETGDGRKLAKELDYPKGDPRNPLSDEEIEQKFDALAAPILSDGARARVKEAVWGLEREGSIEALMQRCVADR